MKEFLEALHERVLVCDGAMGTSIQFRTPTPDDFAGHEGLNEWLNLTRPDQIAENAAHAEVALTPEDLAELEEITSR